MVLRKVTRRLLPVALGLVGAVGLAAALIAIIVAALGGDPVRALIAVQSGAFGSPTSVAETLIKATPLILTGLSVAVAFRCGVWNIGAEGQFLMGMLGSTLAALWLPPLPPALGIPLCLLSGMLFGTIWALLPALLRVRRDVPEVISTIMLNFLAVYLIEYLVRGPIHDPNSASDWSPRLPNGTHLARLGVLTGIRTLGEGSLTLPDGRPILALGVAVGHLHLGVVLAVLAVVFTWLWQTRTRGGWTSGVVGQNPDAAASAGLPVSRILIHTFLFSGALAGLGGAIEVLGLLQRLYRYLPGEPGYGFSGIAVALLGQLHAGGVLAAALFFGALATGCSQMQRSAGVSIHVAYVLQAAAVLVLVCLPTQTLRRWWKKSRILNEKPLVPDGQQSREP